MILQTVSITLLRVTAAVIFQDIELDRVLAEAAVELQRRLRGWMSRKRTRWVRMEREGRRRLSRLQVEIEAEREKSRVLETQRKVLHERCVGRFRSPYVANTHRQAGHQEDNIFPGSMKRSTWLV